MTSSSAAPIPKARPNRALRRQPVRDDMKMDASQPSTSLHIRLPACIGQCFAQNAMVWAKCVCSFTHFVLSPVCTEQMQNQTPESGRRGLAQEWHCRPLLLPFSLVLKVCQRAALGAPRMPHAPAPARSLGRPRRAPSAPLCRTDSKGRPARVEARPALPATTAAGGFTPGERTASTGP